MRVDSKVGCDDDVRAVNTMLRWGGGLSRRISREQSLSGAGQTFHTMQEAERGSDRQRSTFSGPAVVT